MQKTLLPANRTLLLALLLCLFPLAVQAQTTPNAWINELHYDNTGADTGEFVEIVIEDAGNFTLSNFQVLHYNGDDGDSDAAAPVTLDEFTAGTSSNGFSLYSYNYTTNGETLQNSTEALALCFDSNDDGTFETLLTSEGVDQFLSYEGTFTGTADDGCAGGKMSTKIGVDEDPEPDPGESLQLTGFGAAYDGFSWSGPSPESPGNPNDGQTLPNNDGKIAQPTGPGGTKPKKECTAVASDADRYEEGALKPFAKYEEEEGGFVSDLPGGSGDISFDSDPPTVPAGSWTSSTSIAAFLIKQGQNIYYWKNPGTALDYVSPEDEFSHMTFCVLKNQECDTPALAGDDDVDKEEGTVSNTITDDDGVKKFTFTKLDGLKVISDFADGFVKNSKGLDEGGVSWTWEGAGDPPTSVPFKLGATESTVSYFVEVTDACPAGANTLELDPRYEIEVGSGIAQAQLAGNAPNPFSGETTVEFALPEQTRVTVAVYDMMGRKVATLVDGTRRAGIHTLTWNGQSENGQALSSGVYLMRLQADGDSDTRRVTIVR